MIFMNLKPSTPNLPILLVKEFKIPLVYFPGICYLLLFF